MLLFCRKAEWGPDKQKTKLHAKFYCSVKYICRPDTGGEDMNELQNYIKRLPRWLIHIICVLLAAIIGVIDYLTGDISLTVFYLIPIFLAVWQMGRTSGIFIALLCGAELIVVDRLLVASEIHIVSIRTWNSVMEALFLIFAGYILTLLKNELVQKKKRTDELEAANLELDAFNYSVAHDLRKPLTIINGYSQLIMELYGEKLDQQCREDLNEIYQGTLRMSHLIDVLLNFSRLAHSELHVATVDLTEMAKTIVAELRLAEPERKVDVQISEGITALGDPQLLRVVLENLIGNAWKYSSKIKDGAIFFGTTFSGHVPIFYVRDNGAGFDAAKADDIFVPFHRLHSAEEFAGFGIGLATVKRIIQRHGGLIWAESEEHKGATFFFTLQKFIRGKQSVM
jgi:signal transduction histidine kinase